MREEVRVWGATEEADSAVAATEVAARAVAGMEGAAREARREVAEAAVVRL